MSQGTGFVELIFVFGVALALGLWELWRIRREVRRIKKPSHDDVPTDQDGPSS